jgi:crossover junction endodeoxyribonuclease RusA
MAAARNVEGRHTWRWIFWTTDRFTPITQRGEDSGAARETILSNHAPANVVDAIGGNMDSKPNPLSVEFTVYGIPIPQGSTRAFVPKGWTRPIITAANAKTKPWRQEIAGACLKAMEWQHAAGSHVAIRIACAFYFPKPKSVKKSITEKTTKPDLDKLIRSALDALTGIAFEDDSQVTELTASKHFGSPARMEIAIAEADLPPSRKLIYQPIKDSDLPFV